MTKKPPKNLTVASHLSAAKRRTFVYDLRIAGATYSDIVRAARETIPDHVPPSYDERYAHRDVMIVLNKLNTELRESAEQMRTMMLQQIDTVMLTVYQKALTGDAKSVNSFIRLTDQKARLIGAYAPAQVKITDWRSEILQLVKQNRIQLDQVKDYLGEQLYREFVESGSTPLLEAGEIEEGSFTEVEE